MYCGEDAGTDVDRFEPITRTPPRAFGWLGHLLACPPCDSLAKGLRLSKRCAGNALR